MNEMLKMGLVLTVLASVAGGVLAAVNNGTREQIKKQQLEFVKGPAVKSIMTGSVNNPVEDYFTVTDGENERTVFVGSFKDRDGVVAFEEFGKGFGGQIGVMVGYNLSDDRLRGVAVTVQSETPGLGARAKSDPGLVSQFAGMELTDSIKVSKDGGQIDAISGATITSRAVCAAVEQSMQHYQKMKSRIKEQAQKLQKQE
ncbi:MAG: electron transporter RnfG [Desulfobacterales bacterium]|nr:MAG: electron transporter RnfG [Desulfobacterales bacterium]